MWRRLIEEFGADVAESTVRDFVRQVRIELAAERLPAVPVVQEHRAGAEAEVDFGEFQAWIAGDRVRLFILRLSHSARAWAVVFGHQAQEAFFEGHVQAFSHFEGRPARIRYDNLKPAVVRMLIGRDRVENERFIALRSQYGFDSFFCLPGVEGAHEKGGVEGEVGRFRRAHMVPLPRMDSLAHLNAYVRARLAIDDQRRVAGRTETVAESFAVEQAALAPLPAERFDVMRELTAKVDAKARISVVQSHYSVPARYAGRRVIVRLGAEHLEVLDAQAKAIIAVWPRSLHKGIQHLELDHYLEVIARKPGALAGSTALAQARACGAFTVEHQRFWDTARRQTSDREGTRRLCDVLLLQRRLSAEHVTAGIAAALAVDCTDPAVVAVEARRARDEPLAPVIPIEAAAEPCDERPTPSLAGYDALLEATP